MVFNNRILVRRTASFLLVMTAALVVLANLPSSRAQGTAQLARTADGRFIIDSLPITIDTCGSYVVFGCLIGVPGSNGITITTNDVTLDLNGNTLFGGKGTLAGIAVDPGRRNISVKNGGLRKWRSGGVVADGAGLVVLTDLRATENNIVGLSTGMGAQVSQCIVTGTRGPGIVVGPSSRVTDCSSIANERIGITAANGSLVSGAVMNDNDRDGASVSGVLTSSVAYNNGQHGLVVGDGAVYDCASIDNAMNAIQAEDRCLIRSCSASTPDNSSDTVVAYDLGDHCLVSECRADVIANQRAIRMSGVRSIVEGCGFVTSGAGQSAVEWIGTENFVGDGLHTGFISVSPFGPTPNVFGDEENPGTGMTNNFSKFGSLTMFP